MSPQFSFGPLPPGATSGSTREVGGDRDLKERQSVTPLNEISYPSSINSSKPQKVSSWNMTYNKLLGGAISASSSLKENEISQLPSSDDANVESHEVDNYSVAWDALSSSPIGANSINMSHRSIYDSGSASIISPRSVRVDTKPLLLNSNGHNNLVGATEPAMDPATELMHKYRSALMPTSPVATYPFKSDSSSGGNRAQKLRRIESDVLPLWGRESVSNRSEFRAVSDPERIQQLYSPGYLQRSLSMTDAKVGSKMHNQQHNQHAIGGFPSINLFKLELSSKVSLDDGDKGEMGQPISQINSSNSHSRHLSTGPVSLHETKPDSLVPFLRSDDSEEDISLEELEKLESEAIAKKTLKMSDILSKSAQDVQYKITETAELDLSGNHDLSAQNPHYQGDQVLDYDDDIDLAELDRLEEEVLQKRTIIDSNKNKDLNIAADPVSIDAGSSDQDDIDWDLLDCLLNEKKIKSRIQTEENRNRDSQLARSSTAKPDFKSEKLVRARKEEPNRESLSISVLRPKLHRYRVDNVSHDKRRVVLAASSASSVPDTSFDASDASEISAISNTTIILRGMWTETPVEPGDVIHIIGNYHKRSDGSSSNEDTVVVDDDNNLLVLLPDTLVTCTNVADSFDCQRKVILRDRVRTASESSKYLVLGSLIHELFQNCLVTSDFSIDYIHDRIDTLVHDSYLEEMALAGVSTEEAVAELKNIIPNLQKWQSTYLRESPLSSSVVDNHRGIGGQGVVNLSISKVIDIEEEIWSPMFGLKGKIDATIEAAIKMGLDYSGKYLVPLELKSSKSTKSISHRAQTTLYTLLLSDRYDLDVSCGVLYYPTQNEMIRIPSLWDEIRQLISARNQLVRYLGGISRDLPPIIQDNYKCRGCSRNDICAVYHLADGGGTGQSADDVKSLLNTFTEHLTTRHIEFFNKWDSLLTKESSDVNRYLKEIWTMTSKTRERNGRCYGHMVITELVEEKKLNNEGSSRFTYILEREKGLRRELDIEGSQLVSGEPIIVSDESGRTCLAKGYFRFANNRQVKITVDRRLTHVVKPLAGFNAENSQVFCSMILDNEINSQKNGDKQRPVFRIDKDEFGFTMALVRNNLFQLFVKNGDERRRRLIVDLDAPQFEVEDLSANYLQSLRGQLNSDQLRAVDKVLRAKDYALVLGMPGTGKTTTIAAIVKTLVSQNKSVLIACHTHSAVDNIMLKLRNQGFDMLRISHISKVHPDIAPYVASHAYRATTEEEVDKYYFQPPVVGTTCLGIGNWLFAKRKTFDYCIVDEASQITLPSCVGPLRFADKFVLVGDHYQLSPLVRNIDALDGGLDVSLFKYLCENHPQSVVNLEHQYRMCSDIMLLSNKLIYDGKLKCGSELVGNRCLNIPDKRAINGWKKDPEDNENNWLDNVINEQ